MYLTSIYALLQTRHQTSSLLGHRSKHDQPLVFLQLIPQRFTLRFCSLPFGREGGMFPHHHSRLTVCTDTRGYRSLTEEWFESICDSFDAF